MTNKDFIGLTILLIFGVVILSFMKNKPSVAIKDRPSPLPTNLYTNGATSPATSNSVATRVNFHQQPVGQNYS